MSASGFGASKDGHCSVPGTSTVPRAGGGVTLGTSARSAPVSPEATFQFEQQLQLHVREMGRQVLQHTYNSLEPEDVHALPKHVLFEGSSYTRMGRKTPQHVWTLFGQIHLLDLHHRDLYAPCRRVLIKNGL